MLGHLNTSVASRTLLQEVTHDIRTLWCMLIRLVRDRHSAELYRYAMQYYCSYHESSYYEIIQSVVSVPQIPMSQEFRSPGCDKLKVRIADYQSYQSAIAVRDHRP